LPGIRRADGENGCIGGVITFGCKAEVQSVPQRKQPITITKTNLLMLFKKINAVYSEYHTKPMSVLWEKCGIVY
jgi:hypothetical protein